MGLAASVGLLRAIEATGKPENVLGVWAAVQVGSRLSCELSESGRFPWLLHVHEVHSSAIKEGLSFAADIFLFN